MALFSTPSLTNEHVTKIVTRCSKITELNIGGQTKISSNCLPQIIESLQLTLIKLGLKFEKVQGNPALELQQLSDLRKMTKLRVLRYEGYWSMGERYQQVKTHLPHISINSWSDYIAIARPYEKYELEERNGIWEIKVTQTSV